MIEKEAKTNSRLKEERLEVLISLGVSLALGRRFDLLEQINRINTRKNSSIGEQVVDIGSDRKYERFTRLFSMLGV